MTIELFVYILVGITIIGVAFLLVWAMKADRQKETMADFITPKLGEILDRLHKKFRKVLIVDDDELQRDLIRLKMIPENCKVHQATNKDDALKLIGDNNYDLIFLDIRLAGANGGSVLKTMRANNDRTSVVIITGYADAKIYDMALEYDAPIIEKQNLVQHIDFWSRTFLKNA